MRDTSKLPKWVQEELRAFANKVASLERDLARRWQAWDRENELAQDRLEVIEKCKDEIAIDYVRKHYTGE